MEKQRFDTEAFFAALDAQRESRRLTWKQVAEEAGVSASTLTRMAQGKRLDVDGLASLLAWSGLKAETFIKSDPARKSEQRPRALAMISTQLRADPHLSKRNAVALDAIVRAAYDKLRKI